VVRRAQRLSVHQTSVYDLLGERRSARPSGSPRRMVPERISSGGAFGSGQGLLAWALREIRGAARGREETGEGSLSVARGAVALSGAGRASRGAPGFDSRGPGRRAALPRALFTASARRRAAPRSLTAPPKLRYRGGPRPRAPSGRAPGPAPRCPWKPVLRAGNLGRGALLIGAERKTGRERRDRPSPAHRGNRAGVGFRQRSPVAQVTGSVRNDASGVVVDPFGTPRRWRACAAARGRGPRPRGCARSARSDLPPPPRVRILASRPAERRASDPRSPHCDACLPWPTRRPPARLRVHRHGVLRASRSRSRTDRATTTMAGEMCACWRSTDPRPALPRQAIACAACGIRLTLLDRRLPARRSRSGRGPAIAGADRRRARPRRLHLACDAPLRGVASPGCASATRGRPSR
jgi:hypothetical protein